MNSLAEALSNFFIFFGVDDKRRMALYYESLQSEDLNFVIERLKFLRKTWKPAYGEKIPSVAEITTRLIDTKQFQEDFKILLHAAADMLYKKDIPAWATEAVYRLGYDRMLNLKSSDEEKILREFEELYQEVKLSESSPMLEHHKLKTLQPGKEWNELLEKAKNLSSVDNLD